jgi:signal transduction histidine kinase
VIDQEKEFLALLDEAIESDMTDVTAMKKILKQTKRRMKRFDTIVKNADKQLLEQVHEQEKEFDLRMHNERMLAKQAKNAALGEMMDAVAHQWKQPLNALTMYLELLKSDFDDGVVDKGYIKEMQEGMDAQINHMVTTLSEFRNFFRPNNSSVKFNLLKTLNSVMFLTKDEFLKNQIEIKIDVDEDIIIKGNENEFKHLILNIINNAKDAFNENTLSKRIIEIKANKTAEFLSIDICDNAGGIPKSVINHIFESNFTTKKEGKGTGIGLYMSMQIVKKMGGELSVTNKDSGACFHISGIPKVF